MGTKYQSQSASGYNSSPPSDDGSITAANKITWSGIKTKLGDPVKTEADAINTQLVTALDYSATSTSTNYTTTASDHEKLIEVSGTTTISLGDAATMGAGYRAEIYNKGTATVTVALATNTNTLAGQTNGTVTLPPGATMLFVVAQSVLGYDIRAATGFAPFVLTGAAGTNTATANAPANLIALFNGLLVSWTPANTNTGALTLNITPSGGSALTAKNVFNDGAACVGNEAKASVPLLLQYDGTQFNIIGRREFKQPTRQVLTSGSGATYTTPTGATRIVVRMVGGGGGGAAQSTNNGANGNDTTFSTLTAAKGSGGTVSGAGGAGGAGTNGDINITGAAGCPGTVNNASVAPCGGIGGAAAFGGAGAGGFQNSAGGNAATNSGSGGGGAGGTTAPVSSGGGGGAGGYVEKLITAPSATYTYTVGAGGAGGAAGGVKGGDGAAGIIIVDEFYN